MLKTISLILLLFITYTSYGQSTPTDITDNFFKIYKTKGSNQAVDYLFSTNKYSAESNKEIDNIKEKLNANAPSFGGLSGYEIVLTKTIGKDLVLLTLIVKYERIPLVFKMLFYRPAADWQIQDFTFNTDIGAVLKDSK